MSGLTSLLIMCVCGALECVRESGRRRRHLHQNSFSGPMPASIGAMPLLSRLCVSALIVVIVVIAVANVGDGCCAGLLAARISRVESRCIMARLGR